MNYWWLNANPNDPDDPWSWTASKRVGEMEEWYARGDKGKRKPYVLRIKEGDLVLGYNTGNEKALVALAFIAKEMYVNQNGEEVFGVIKIKDLDNPISFSNIKKVPLFNNKFSNDIKLRGTLKPLSLEEFIVLLKMIQ